MNNTGAVIKSAFISADGKTPLSLVSEEYSLIKVINVYESIFEQYSSAEVFVDDAIGLIEQYPVTGYEFMTISFNANPGVYEEEGDLTKVFRIFDITELAHDSKQPRMYYRIQLVSDALIQSNKHQLQCSYKGKTESDIVKIIAEKNLNIPTDSLNIEASLESRSLTIPNMTPLETIDYMTMTAINKQKSRISNFMFFENKDGYNFVSLDTLFGQNVSFTLKSNIVSGDPSTSKTAESNIIDMKVNSVLKPIEHRKNYMFGGTMQEVDLIEKKTTKKEFSFEQDVLPKQVEIDDSAYLPWDADQDSARSRIDTFYNFGSFKHGKETIPTRLMSMQQMDAINITCTLTGNTTLTAGMKIKLDYPSINATDTENKNHKYISGNYIIGNIRHEIAFGKVKTIVDLFKPTFINEIEGYNE